MKIRQLVHLACVRQVIHFPSVRQQILKTVFSGLPFTVNTTSVTINNTALTINTTHL